LKGAMITYRQEREELGGICQRAFMLDMQGSTGGNVSARVAPASSLVKPSAVSFSDTETGDLLVVDLSGRLLDGREQRHG